jgi:hypothetical protein
MMALTNFDCLVEERGWGGSNNNNNNAAISKRAANNEATISKSCLLHRGLIDWVAGRLTNSSFSLSF